MNKSLKYYFALILTGIMLIGNTCNAYAEEIGPGIEYDKQHPNEDTTQASTEGSTADTSAQENHAGDSQTQNESAAAGAEAPNAAAEADVANESAAAAEEAAKQANSPMSVPKRLPHLQTTILLQNGQWSAPFVNDQWITDNNSTFISISIFLTEIIGDIHYRAYTSVSGWTPWAMNGQQTTLASDWAPIEAVQIRVSGPIHNDYDIYYTTNLNDGTQTDWAMNGATAGTMNQGKALTGFRMSCFAKGDTFPYSMEKPVVSAHADGIQTIDGALRYISGDGSNFTGWGYQDADRYYFVDSNPVTGWQYIDGYKYYFGNDGKMATDLEPIIGAGGPYHIKINKEMNTMTIYVQDGANGFIIPLKSFLVSTGDDTPLGTFKTPDKYRWRLMNSGVYAQYATRLGPGLPFLMHSVIFDRPDTYSAWASTYNHMGVARSAGCIRLLSGNAKWIFDHCPLNTPVTVYNDYTPGPYDRPTIAAEIPFAQTWDPTDPNITPEGIAAATAAIMAKAQTQTQTQTQ